ncbi:DR2241 family protein [Halomicrococcus sp. NG-SE-24]|uniref:DR2241 family protein n=1 Tax=Halomicrococcus sp. NG-SE-24 TaxID=3436928 RepID=UPI003D95A75F
MSDSKVEELLAAAADGVAFDGLRVARDDRDAGLAFETPEDRRVGLTEAEFRAVARDHATYVDNWHHWERVVEGHGGYRRAFLRWLEPDDAVPARYDALADGVTRTWGQLAVTVRRADGERRYELRHVDDRESERTDLDERTDPREARELAKYDAEGEYRPLKTAPTLRTGWVLVDLSGDDYVRAVDWFYPATVANWHREREGDLDVTHWRETADRQTGIYADVDDLSGDALDRAARACCADSQCLKRREWDEASDADVDAPRGDGEFPCREACSLFVAAAREFAATDEESTRELTLTSEEHEQLSALVDAAAEGRVEGVRPGDVNDPANRYRARYLRETRFANEES